MKIQDRRSRDAAVATAEFRATNQRALQQLVRLTAAIRRKKVANDLGVPVSGPSLGRVLSLAFPFLRCLHLCLVRYDARCHAQYGQWASAADRRRRYGWFADAWAANGVPPERRVHTRRRRYADTAVSLLCFPARSLRSHFAVSCSCRSDPSQFWARHSRSLWRAARLSLA
jgi:hypothetical protein